MKVVVLVVVALVAFMLFRAVFNRGTDETSSEVRLLPAPDDWDRWERTLNSAALPSLKISLAENKPQDIRQSKFGGLPFWPAGKHYPLDRTGKPLLFIAQINFSEINEVPEGYPKEGLLQFFVASDDLWGLEFFKDKSQFGQYLQGEKNFAVVFHPAPAEPEAELNMSVLKALESDRAPMTGETAIAFSLVQDVASPVDYRFERIVHSLGPATDELMDYAYETLGKSPDHKLGGYASFTQDDPRGYYAEDDEWLLLFQMDSDSNSNIDIMWGDVGIANFFIRPDDLKNLDFEHVWYNWDCH